MSVVANISLSLSCVAHGPPEPVRVIWLQDGAPLNSLSDPVALSPSMLNLTGIICHSLLPQQSRPHTHSLVWVQPKSTPQGFSLCPDIAQCLAINYFFSLLNVEEILDELIIQSAACGPK